MIRLKNSNKYFERIGEEKYNNQGCLMKIVEYKNSSSIVVEFQDSFKTRINSAYKEFRLGNIRNPYHPSVCGIGMIGAKYPSKVNNINTKEYLMWRAMLERCFVSQHKAKHPTYINATCCDEWLLFENFYEWLHSQENFEKWLNGKQWAIDKDILIKRNKIYSPETCCLVPMNVNNLFTKCDAARGNTPIGVCKRKYGFEAWCKNPFTDKIEYLGLYPTSRDAFFAYKIRKEYFIKQVAQIEYDNGNIIKQCYEAMMNYEVEIID